jgi:hypothetical protein
MGHPIEIAKEENNGKKKTAPGWRGLGILRFWDFAFVALRVSGPLLVR